MLVVVRDYYVDQRYAPRAAAFMETTARAVRDAGVHFAFVQMPYHPAHLRLVDRFHPTARAVHRARLVALAGGLGVPFLDWSEGGCCGLGDADFADGVHLSARGARRFSAFLGEWLAGRRAKDVAVPVIGRRTRDGG
jgi:hypothetical protein